MIATQISYRILEYRESQTCWSILYINIIIFLIYNNTSLSQLVKFQVPRVFLSKKPLLASLKLTPIKSHSFHLKILLFYPKFQLIRIRRIKKINTFIFVNFKSYKQTCL